MTDITPLRATSEKRQSVRALRLGRRLRLAGLEAADLHQAEAITASPLILRLGGGGIAALLPYGTVVLVGVSPGEEEAFLQKLGDRVESRLDAPVIVASEISIGTSEGISGDIITIRDLSPARLVAVADALAKNVALAFEEEEVRNVLEALEPIASDLASSGQLPWKRRRMLRTVGHALLTHHRLLERVEVEERPELPNDGETGRLHDRLAEAYHFKKRAKALSRKLDAVEVMMTALTELIDAQRGIRLETMIVLLIMLEISVYLYDLFLRPG
ncbi:RMD1 family protein [Bradyrhizobium sediminis]|uniref:RMD1 family protein n=1 Tax=Bradyrhizobium sediminis TaxID=2840469 RepID=A0A975P0T0_9BRAD|nr:RMD1 family protein [Bradyrhizobium sediminis]QWG24500.1 RMD1 family protein [Bradyrhizobium sediminis]